MGGRAAVHLLRIGGSGRRRRLGGLSCHATAKCHACQQQENIRKFTTHETVPRVFQGVANPVGTRLLGRRDRPTIAAKSPCRICLMTATHAVRGIQSAINGREETAIKKPR